MTFKRYCNLILQPIALYTVTQNGIHIRQTVKSAVTTSSNTKWKLNLDQDDILFTHLKTVVIGELTTNCTEMVKSNGWRGIKLPSKTSIDSMIIQMSTVKSFSGAIVFSSKINTTTFEFPSATGTDCLGIIRAAQITNSNRRAGTTKVKGQKIKIKLALKHRLWNNRLTSKQRGDIQKLGMDLACHIIKDKHVFIGTAWTGTFYSPVLTKICEQKEEFTWFPQEQKPTISKFEMYVKYDDKDKPLESLKQLQIKQKIDDEKEIEKVSIGCVSFENIFYSQRVKTYFKKAFYDFMMKSENFKLETGKVETNHNMNRIKYWPWGCFYYFDCQDDHDKLGRNYEKAMEVANGIRIQNGYSWITPLKQLMTGLIQYKVIEEKTDAAAINIYYNNTAKSVSSGICSHYEDDRFKDVVHVTFTSDEPPIHTALSINQREQHGTAEIEIQSKDCEVLRFDS